MNASRAVKTMLNMTGKKQTELAEYFCVSPQSMWNKMHHDRWPYKDLISVAKFANCKIGFILPDGNILYLTEK